MHYDRTMSKNKCRTFLHPNGYTNVSICDCKYGSEHHEKSNKMQNL